MCLKLTLQELSRPRTSIHITYFQSLQRHTHPQMKMNRHVLSAREEFICGGAQDI